MESASIEFLEAEAWRQRGEALPAQLQQRLGTRVRRFGRALALATPGADVATVNRTIGIGLDQPLDDALLAEVHAFFRDGGALCAEVNASFRDAGVPRWLSDCGPDATIVGGAETLTRQGGVLKTPTVKLVGELRDITAAHRDGISVREVGRESAETFTSIVGEAFGLPESVKPDIASAIGKTGWRYYMAFDAERPLAGAAMFVQDGGAWFGVAGTAADARNRGAQSALLARRLSDAKRVRCFLWA